MFLEVMLFSITCSIIFSLRLYLTLDEIKEILSPAFVLGSLFSFCWLALVRMLPRLSRVTRIRPKRKVLMASPFSERGGYVRRMALPQNSKNALGSGQSHLR